MQHGAKLSKQWIVRYSKSRKSNSMKSQWDTLIQGNTTWLNLRKLLCTQRIASAEQQLTSMICLLSLDRAHNLTDI